MNFNLDVLANIGSVLVGLIIFGYKLGLIEKRLEKLIDKSELNLTNKINQQNEITHQLRTELLILKEKINKDDEISGLLVSRTEQELKQEIKFIHLQIKQIIKSLENANFPVKHIEKDTLR